MGASRVDLMREAIKSVVHLMRDAISDHPWPSRANQSHQRSSVVIRGHPRSSVYQDGDTPRDRQKVDVAEEDREPHDGSTKPALVLAAADDWGGATPSPNRPGRHRHVDGAERLVVSGHELEEDLRGNQRHSEAILGNERQSEAIRGHQSVPRRELEAVCVHGRPAVVDAGEKAETHPRDEQPKGDDEERRHQRNDEETTLHARM